MYIYYIVSTELIFADVTEHESGNFVCSIPRLAYKNDYVTLFVFGKY